ncbi:BZ3500_MvSof-1268-A1-R1_Chr6-2g08570 [Microbotryum saponariae]|uniref:BZ3500_MvSof-1268-A1-R1_Chr6-2g08570 protein n=1 Tax=Microbotryum saponariae TaxID=289078 RepID=A0A2X0MEY8_9BASI|nr:BZ3500_MvSof-1268-A1-R1_Chr6-2g08570 [Microbotryum saponariae]SDA07845.1 BZ3501_MvSof-1269-A2-R1_Chr6-1g08282 [Microbotryum saponariae]
MSTPAANLGDFLRVLMAVQAVLLTVPPRIGTSAPLEAIIPKPVARFAMEQRLPDPVLPQQASQYTLLNMARPYTSTRRH